VEVNEETTNLTGTSTPEPQVPDSTFANQKDGELAPGCQPGESPNTAGGCDHDSHEQIHYPGDEKKIDKDVHKAADEAAAQNRTNAPDTPAKDPEAPSAAESSEPAKDKTGELPVRLGEGYHTDVRLERKQRILQSQKAGVERGEKHNAAVAQNQADDEAEDFEHLKGRVIRREKYAKYFVKTQESASKKEKYELMQMKSRNTVDKQLQQNPPEPQRLMNTNGTNASANAPVAPLANESAVLDEQRAARDEAFTANNKAMDAKKRENVTIESEKYKQEFAIAFPTPVGTDPPSETKADESWDYLNHDKYENQQHTMMAVTEERQINLDADRVKGAVAVGYNGNVSGMLTVKQYESAEREVKLNQAQYDKGKGRPVERESPRKIYVHHPGADVIAVPAPSKEPPQYGSRPEKFEPTPDDEHGPTSDSGSSSQKPEAMTKSNNDVQSLDSDYDY